MSITEAERRAAEAMRPAKRAGPPLGDRIAVWAWHRLGSWPFLGLLTVSIATWIGWQSLSGRPFDPYPYILLNLGLSFLAAYGQPLIMLATRRLEAGDREQTRHALDLARRTVDLLERVDARQARTLELLASLTGSAQGR